MKTIIINEKEINIPEGWTEITFEKFLSFSKLVRSHKSEEEVLKEYREMEMSEEVLNLQVSLDNIQFNTKIACFWSGLDEEEIAMCSLEEVEELIKSINFVNEQYMPIELDKFKFKDVTYVLPKPGMREQNFGTYIEAEQIEMNNKNLENGNLDILPRQVAILCRKEGEEVGIIKDHVVDEREKLFRQLDMATVWDVAFFLLKLESQLMNSFLISLKTMETEKLESQPKTL
jgi:hypothetical protein|tara:strand:+ start:147 stop:839 length:693 start_codon:yes stop_codon:yes gene_type:complete